MRRVQRPSVALFGGVRAAENPVLNWVPNIPPPSVANVGPRRRQDHVGSAPNKSVEHKHINPHKNEDRIKPGAN